MIIKQPDGGYHVADASNLTKKIGIGLLELQMVQYLKKI